MLEMISIPTVERINPALAIMRALIIEPWAMYVTMVRDMIIRAKYSGEEKLTAALPSTGAKNISPTMLIVPAMKDPKAAIPRAAPARPCRANGCPSKHGDH